VRESAQRVHHGPSARAKARVGRQDAPGSLALSFNV
jgi:hypothetical protein